MRKDLSKIVHTSNRAANWSASATFRKNVQTRSGVVKFLSAAYVAVLNPKPEYSLVEMEGGQVAEQQKERSLVVLFLSLSNKSTVKCHEPMMYLFSLFQKLKPFGSKHF